MRKILLLIIAATLTISNVAAHSPKKLRKLKQEINFIVASDLDKHGCYDQKVIAELMGETAKQIKPCAIIVSGDTHHGNGVKSATDNDWKERFEDIYTHPSLQIEWYAALGNHEHRGSTQAVIDYSRLNHRWNMPSRYYTKVFQKGSLSIRLVVLDTTPLIEKYRRNEKYADASLEDKEVQIEWLDSVLSKATEDWVIVVGHHPIYADTKKDKTERSDMKSAINETLRRYNNVSFYICGHIHNFQHLRSKGGDIDYIVNSSASESRSVKITKRTKYCSPETGFSIITAGKKSLALHMVDKNGNILHTVRRDKK
jgi:DNA repair exonuclease SbcCD nuclease subunit